MQFVVLLLVLDVLGLAKNILCFSTSAELFNYAEILVMINILIYISWVLIMSLKDPGMFTGLYSEMQLVKKLLDSYLSVRDLASQLDMNIREFSLLINHTLNQHFFDFVNHYRIQKAKSILSDPEKKQVTVLEVLYEVGFNSKSSINTVFKKQTGMTPTQFRKSQFNQTH